MQTRLRDSTLRRAIVSGFYRGSRMALHRFEKGELGHWLRVVADNGEPGAEQTEVPEHVAKALETLRCIQAGADGQWRITDKGRLALRMEEPGAIHLR